MRYTRSLFVFTLENK